MTIQLLQGDCLDLLPTLPAQSVDLVLSDWPYEKTGCQWDSIIPLAPLWAELRRVLKPTGAVVTTAQQPFTTDLIQSNRAWFKYTLVWDKVRPVDWYSAKFRPMTRHEDICVFAPGTCAQGGKANMIYRPIMQEREKPLIATPGAYTQRVKNPKGRRRGAVTYTYTHRYPTSIIQFAHTHYTGSLHPTQKPLALFEYLMRTYSNPDDVVLDNAFGSCTTGEAAIRLDRHFIGMEKDAGYFAIGSARCAAAQAAYQPQLLEVS